MASIFARFIVCSLLALAGSGCLVRVDAAQTLQNLPRGAARDRLSRLFLSPACRALLAADDAECWQIEGNKGVQVETGLSRSAAGYRRGGDAVQTHMKVRIRESGTQFEQVYYFADAGPGGLDRPDDYGAADGSVNVFCVTTPDSLSRQDTLDNTLVGQQQVDLATDCVHFALETTTDFAEPVKNCLASFRHDRVAAPAVAAHTTR